MPVIQPCRFLLPYCSWGLVYMVRSKDCVYFRHIYLITWCLPVTGQRHLFCRLSSFWYPMTRWMQCDPSSWSFVWVATVFCPVSGHLSSVSDCWMALVKGEVIIAFITYFPILSVVWWCECEGNLLFSKSLPLYPSWTVAKWTLFGCWPPKSSFLR